MRPGIELFNASGTRFFSTELQTWNYVGSFVVPSGYASGTVREPSSGNYSEVYAPGMSYTSWNCYSNTGTLQGTYTTNVYWNGSIISSVSGLAYSMTIGGWTYFMDQSYAASYYTAGQYGSYGYYELHYGVYRTQVQQIFTPQSVTVNLPVLSMMSEVILQRSAMDNPPANQEGYIHSASRSGDNVTANGGNVRTLVVVLGR